MNQRADIMWSVGGNTQQFDRAVQTSRTKANRALSSIGTSIEKRTEGARRFAGALSSTAGVISGIAGPLAIVGGLVTSVALGWERARNAARESAEMVARNRAETQAMLRELRADRGAGSSLGEQIESTVNPLRERMRELRAEASRLRGRAAMAEEAGVIGNLGTVVGLGTDPTGNRSRAAELEGQALQIGQESGKQTQRIFATYRATVRERLREVDAQRALSAAQREGLAFEAQRIQVRRRGEQEIADLIELRDQALLDNQNDIAKEIERRMTTSRRAIRDELAGIDEAESAETRRLARSRELADVQARVELLRADGQDESADALQRQLALQQQIDAINQNDLYTQERKKELIEAQTKAAERYEDAIRRNQRAEAMSLQQRLEVMALRAAGLTEEANQYRSLIEHQERLKEIEALREISQAERLRLIELSEQILSGELNGSGEGGSGGSARFGSAIPLQAGEFAARIGGGANTQEKLAQKGNSLLEKISGQVDRAIEAVRESRGAAYG